MSHKMKVSYQLDTADENAKTAVENLLKSLMDWVRIDDNEWLVLANRHTTKTLQAELDKLIQSKYSVVSVVDKKKTKITNNGYIDAKNGEASEMLFSSKY